MGEVAGQPLITIEGAPVYATRGQLDLTTVSENGGPGRRLSLLEALAGWVRPAVAVLPEDLLYPPDADPAELEQLLLSHIVDGTALDAAAVFDGSRTDVTVASGGTQLIVQDPPTIGGATVVQADLLSTNGVSHGIDALLPPSL